MPVPKIDPALILRICSIIGCKNLKFKYMGTHSNEQIEFETSIPISAMGCFAFAVKEVYLGLKFWDKRKVSAQIRLSYMHSDLVGSGSNGIGFDLYKTELDSYDVIVGRRINHVARRQQKVKHIPDWSTPKEIKEYMAAGILRPHR